jgi:hypothetical protein
MSEPLKVGDIVRLKHWNTTDRYSGVVTETGHNGFGQWIRVLYFKTDIDEPGIPARTSAAVYADKYERYT